MTFDQIPAGAEVFLDANILIYHFTDEPTYGTACTGLIERIEQGDVQGFTSAAALSDASHRLMTIEAMGRCGWPAAGLAARLRKRHAEIPQLALFQQAVENVSTLGIVVWSVGVDAVLAAAKLCRQFELLAGDALIVAMMQANGLTHLASGDADFDRVPWIARFAPA